MASPASGSSALRLRKRQLFRKLGYEPHAGQVLVHRSPARRRVLACGARFGKTTCAVYEVVAALLEPREAALGWFVAPTHEIANRAFLAVLTAFRGHMPHRVRSLNLREHELSVTNL